MLKEEGKKRGGGELLRLFCGRLAPEVEGRTYRERTRGWCDRTRTGLLVTGRARPVTRDGRDDPLLVIFISVTQISTCRDVVSAFLHSHLWIHGHLRA